MHENRTQAESTQAANTSSEQAAGGDGMSSRNVAISVKKVLVGTPSTLIIGEQSFRIGEGRCTGAVTGAEIVSDGSDGVGTDPPGSAAS